MYVVDGDRIRKVTPLGVVTTLGGGVTGSEDGTGPAARFWAPRAIAVDAVGALYIADSNNHAIRKAQFEDDDRDGLPDEWELLFGLNPLVAVAPDGSLGDADGDGLTNVQEFARGTHPRGSYTRYLTEGASTDFFNWRLALLNPAGLNRVWLRFQRKDGTTVTHRLELNGLARATLAASDVPGLAGSEFSTVIESEWPLVVDRLMTWDSTGYGAHAESASAAPSLTWYLAEGATHSGFQLFYLVYNPNTTSVSVAVTYLRPPPAEPLTQVYTVPPGQRFNIWVNHVARKDVALSGLAETDVSATFVASQPILVERAMYLDAQGLLFGAGHESAAVPAPALTWHLAEGATGPYFDEFVLIANPTLTTAEVDVRYQPIAGPPLTKRYVVAPRSRFTIWVNGERFPGLGTALATTALSATVTSANGVPVVVERTMWWPSPAPMWMDAHSSSGATATGTLWGLAEGEAGGVANAESYIVVANTSPFAGTARVTIVPEGEGPLVRYVALPPDARVNVAVVESWFPGVTGKRFGVLVESLGVTPAQIVVEGVIYFDAAGVHWAAGASVAATRLVP